MIFSKKVGLNLLSPKTYIFGTDDSYKRSLKGVPKRLTVTVDEFRGALYRTESVKKSFCKLQFLRKPGTVALIKTEKRALNGCYSKFRVRDNLVECDPF